MTEEWEALFQNDKGGLKLRLIENSGRLFLEDESGQRQPYTATLQDSQLGPLVHVKTNRI
jgi:hypothetical protein